MSESSQKYIGRNRGPRVQIEYDLETEGATRKVDLPFIMTVMSDLKGQLQEGEEATDVVDRDFEQVDAAGLDGMMKKMRPRVTLQVPNRLSDEEQDSEKKSLPVDLTFTSMQDFSPARVALQVEPLKELYDVRQQLKTLLSMMDGKAKAEGLIERVLNDDALLKSLKNTSVEDLKAAMEATDGDKT